MTPVKHKWVWRVFSAAYASIVVAAILLGAGVLIYNLVNAAII